jgi:hypothetical protein
VTTDPIDPDDPGIDEDTIHAMDSDDINAMISLYGLDDLASDATGPPTIFVDAQVTQIRRALILARNRGWDAAVRSRKFGDAESTELRTITYR